MHASASGQCGVAMAGGAHCRLPSGHGRDHEPDEGLTRSPAPGVPLTAGATQTRRYHGNYAEASAQFDSDARHLRSRDWYPISQTYVAGSWRGRDWLRAFLLLVFVVGLIVLAYMIAARPAGELVVVYEYRPAPSAAGPVTVAPRPIDSITARLSALQDLHERGLISEEEWAARRREILAET